MSPCSGEKRLSDEADSAVAEVIQVLLVQSEMVTDFVKDRLSHLLYQFRLIVAHLFNGFLKDINYVGHSAGILDAALGPGPSDI